MTELPRLMVGRKVPFMVPPAGLMLLGRKRPLSLLQEIGSVSSHCPIYRTLLRRRLHVSDVKTCGFLISSFVNFLYFLSLRELWVLLI